MKNGASDWFNLKSLNWTKVGLKDLLNRVVYETDEGLNWTKVGLKVALVDLRPILRFSGLNWTKVGLKG